MKEDLQKEIVITGWEDGEDNYKQWENYLIFTDLVEALRPILLGEKLPEDVWNKETGEIIIPSKRKVTRPLLRKMASVHNHVELEPQPISGEVNRILDAFHERLRAIKEIIESGKKPSLILSKETLTHWGRPKSRVLGSSYGPVRYREWCEKERWRVNTRANANIIKLVTRHGGPMDGWIALKR